MRTDSPAKLLLGLTTGVAFGWLLKRGRVASNEAILNQLLFRDSTVFKVMATAVAVGSVGVHALVHSGHAQLQIKPMNAGVVMGGLLFGPGMALLGYCPGTSMAAAGAGYRDAGAGLIGMLAGAGAFVAAYPKMKPLLQSFDRGKATLPKLTKTPTWPWLIGLCSVVGVASVLGELRQRSRRRLRPRF